MYTHSIEKKQIKTSKTHMYSHKTIIYQDKGDWDNVIYFKQINRFRFDN